MLHTPGMKRTRKGRAKMSLKELKENIEADFAKNEAELKREHAQRGILDLFPPVRMALKLERMEAKIDLLFNYLISKESNDGKD